jgi:hypothetical protein
MAVKIRRAEDFESYFLAKLDEDRRTILMMTLTPGVPASTRASNEAALALVNLIADYFRTRWTEFTAAPPAAAVAAAKTLASIFAKEETDAAPQS